MEKHEEVAVSGKSDWCCNARSYYYCSLLFRSLGDNGPDDSELLVATRVMLS